MMRYQEVDIDMRIDGICVSVYRSGNDYELFFLDLDMKVSVYEKQIIGFSVHRN